VGNFWTTLGHRVNAAGRWLLIHLWWIECGIRHAFSCIGHGIWRVVRWLGALIGWMTHCIAVLHELTDQRIWPALLMIALPIAGSMMFSLVQSVNVMPAMEVAPISAPPPTPVPTPTVGFRWARVVGTEGVGLLVRNVPNGKRRLGDGLREGATVMVIGGPVTTANTHNPIWWHVRHNGVTGWASGRFLTFTDQAP